MKLAEAYGATGIRLTDKTTLVDDVRAALRDARAGARRRPRDAEENVYPMIAPGWAARNMVG